MMLPLLERMVVKQPRTANMQFHSRRLTGQHISADASPFFLCHGRNDCWFPVQARGFVDQLRAELLPLPSTLSTCSASARGTHGDRRGAIPGRGLCNT